MPEKSKPSQCRWCGGITTVSDRKPDRSNNLVHQVCCLNCGTSGPELSDREEAIIAHKNMTFT